MTVIATLEDLKECLTKLNIKFVQEQDQLVMCNDEYDFPNGHNNTKCQLQLHYTPDYELAKIK